jgi:N-acyl-L-homoserine lactone synthetase
MIKILTNSDRDKRADLFDEMYRARAAVFHDRLGWNVRVRDGREIDRYDTDEDSVYLLSLDDDGNSIGSLRLLPTTSETMLCNEFAGFFDEPVNIRSPTAWECTRFCVHPSSMSEERNGGRRVSSDLLIGLCELALSSGVEHIIGLYETHMTRVYRRIGWSPQPLAIARPEIGKLVVGIWEVSHAAVETMQARAEELANPGLTRQAA